MQIIPKNAQAAELTELKLLVQEWHDVRIDESCSYLSPSSPTRVPEEVA